MRIYAPKDADGKSAPRLLLDRLKKEEPRGVVLVVGHSNTVPEILAALGYPEKVEIPATQFDDLFVVTPRGAARGLRAHHQAHPARGRARRRQQ